MLGVDDRRDQRVARGDQVAQVVELRRRRAVLVDAAVVHPHGHLQVLRHGRRLGEVAQHVERVEDELELVVLGVVRVALGTLAGTRPAVRDEYEEGARLVKLLAWLAQVGVGLAGLPVQHAHCRLVVRPHAAHQLVLGDIEVAPFSQRTEAIGEEAARGVPRDGRAVDADTFGVLQVRVAAGEAWVFPAPIDVVSEFAHVFGNSAAIVVVCDERNELVENQLGRGVAQLADWIDEAIEIGVPTGEERLRRRFVVRRAPMVGDNRRRFAVGVVALIHKVTDHADRRRGKLRTHGDDVRVDLLHRCLDCVEADGVRLKIHGLDVMGRCGLTCGNGSCLEARHGERVPAHRPAGCGALLPSAVGRKRM